EETTQQAVCAGATADGELVLDHPRPSMRLEDPFGIVWFLYVPSIEEISCDHRRNTHDLLERPRKKKRRRPVEQEDDPNASYLSKLKNLLKIPDPLKEEAAVKFYSTAFGAGAPQFPTKNEIPDITSTHLELARNYYIMISRTEQNMDLSSGINLCARTHHVEELVERLERVGAELEGNIVYDNPIDKFRRMAKVRDPFGVTWFIHDITLEERCISFIDILERKLGEGDTSPFGKALRLRKKAAREGKMWPAVGPEFIER
ncbi:hypothetical protein Tsubulata_048148, partial [Turnera subulata]